jgi:hypothetical protein
MYGLICSRSDIYILRREKIITKNGKQTLFCKDVWLNGKPICIIALVLYDWCKQKNLTINQFLSMEGRIKFDRWLPPSLFEQWVDIINQVYLYDFKNEEDVVRWKWSGKCIYTVKSVYDHLTINDKGRHFQHAHLKS